jgi:hypothetical protein
VYVPATRAESNVRYAENETFTPNPRVVVTESLYGSGNYFDIGRIARGWGHRDGFKDGYKAGLKFRPYSVEDNDDFRDANNGYRRMFGSKFLYKSEYRNGYVSGYESGFRSVSRSETYVGLRN